MESATGGDKIRIGEGKQLRQKRPALRPGRLAPLKRSDQEEGGTHLLQGLWQANMRMRATERRTSDRNEAGNLRAADCNGLGGRSFGGESKFMAQGFRRAATAETGRMIGEGLSAAPQSAQHPRG